MFTNAIDFLLKNACVNIRYLIHRDMLNIPVDDPVMQKMQVEVLQSPMVQKCLSKQHPDGWLGHELHGGDGMDGLMGILLRCGTEASNPCVQKAVNALVTPETAEQHKNYFAAGDALDADGRGGNKSIAAWILSTTCFPEDKPPLSEAIQLSFDHLSGSLEHNNLSDFVIEGTKFNYYKPFVKFPGANHIGILANTRKWQTGENLQTAKAAVTHCYTLMRNVESYIMFRKPKEFGNGFIGPFNYDWRSLNPIEMQDLQKMIDNEKNRFRFGFYIRSLHGHPVWAIQTTQPYELLSELLEKDTLMNIMTDKTLEGFRHLCGIEPRWCDKVSVKSDLTFAVLNACWAVLTAKGRC